MFSADLSAARSMSPRVFRIPQYTSTTCLTFVYSPSVLKKVMSSLAVDVCLHNRTPTPAIELLEQGRGVF